MGYIHLLTLREDKSQKNFLLMMRMRENISKLLLKQKNTTTAANLER
jgi:hypothetical protein